MTALLSRPLGAAQMAFLAPAIALAVAAYCVAYSRLAGQPEQIGEAIVWAVINVLPWFFAFEAAKRARSARGCLGALAAGLLLSLGLGLASAPAPVDTGFELLRRLPALLLLAGLILAGRLAPSLHAAASAAQASLPLPLPPDRIERVAAAGNYVEIRPRDGPVLVHRASLGEVERDLARHGFVRIHRSHLVRRDSIARIRPADVILLDGTSLKTGKRFRAGLGG
jgi:hypothetical protein